MKRIAFLVSGGDAAGIRACLFGIASAAQHHNVEWLAVPYGLEGLIEGHFEDTLSLQPGVVSYGGSPIPSARSARFRQERWQRCAADQVRAAEVDGLVILGGDGSAKAAQVLAGMGVLCVCIPVTIDNDIWGTDYSLGFDSGVQHIRNALVGIQETAQACRGRVFCVETLGAMGGHIALAAGLAGGADLILLPELRPLPSAVALRTKALLDGGKEWVVIVIGEGALGNWQAGDQGVAFTYAEEIRQLTGAATRITIIGHAMRGAPPTSFDAVLGQLMGQRAVDLLQEGKANQMVVLRNNRLGSIDLASLEGKKKELHPDQLSLARVRGCLVPQ